MELNAQILPYKTRQELLEMLVNEAQVAECELDEDTQYVALSNIEQIIYALKNYNLEVA